jgi:hypothetical protein
MALINSFRDVPPGGWKYVQPETGVWFHSDTFDSLVAKIKPHREYKGISVENLELDVQRQLCIRLDPGHCRPEPGEDYRPVKDLTASLTTGMALSLTKAVTAFLASGDPLVDKTEAERRAAICRGCPLNKPASLCSCSAVYKIVEALVPKDRKLGGISVCMACGCSLQAKANLPMSAITASLPPDLVVPPWCWQKETPPPP